MTADLVHGCPPELLPCAPAGPTVARSGAVARPAPLDGRRRSFADPDAAVLGRLRVGDRHIYSELVDTYSPQMLRVALRHTRCRAVAEEAVQETWLAVVQGVDRFEGRASLKTWIFRILVYQAQVARSARRAYCP